VHLEDMHRHWPQEVPGKEKTIFKARRHLAMVLVQGAAWEEYSEAEKLLQHLPGYGDFFTTRLLAGLVRAKGAGIIRAYCRHKSRLRQTIKKLLYKSQNYPVSAAGLPGS
jgi:hypothetical protein